MTDETTTEDTVLVPDPASPTPAEKPKTWDRKQFIGLG